MKNDQGECEWFAWKSLYSMNKERKTDKEIDRHGDRERERDRQTEKRKQREIIILRKKREAVYNDQKTSLFGSYGG